MVVKKVVKRIAELSEPKVLAAVLGHAVVLVGPTLNIAVEALYHSRLAEPGRHAMSACAAKPGTSPRR
jgi:hypothetical protein